MILASPLEIDDDVADDNVNDSNVYADDDDDDDDDHDDDDHDDDDHDDDDHDDDDHDDDDEEEEEEKEEEEEDVDEDADVDVNDAVCVCDKKLRLVKYYCVCIRPRFSLCLHHNITPVASKKLLVTPQWHQHGHRRRGTHSSATGERPGSAHLLFFQAETPKVNGFCKK